MEIAFILLSGINATRLIVFGVVVLLLAFLVGKRSQRNGYPFWRSFIMATISFSSIGLLLINLIG